MDSSQGSIIPVYKIQYSNDVVFYWTIWNHYHRVPLIKCGDVFVPVNEHHTRILLAAQIIAIAELRMNGEHPNARSTENGVQGMVFGFEFSCQNELAWGAIVFGDNDNDFEHHRNVAKKELTKLLISH